MTGTQLVVASTLFGAASVVAAIDGGLLDAGDRQRVLLVCNCAPMPELTPALDEIPAAASVLRRFDRVVRLADVIAPLHPQRWSPREEDLLVLQRLLRSAWGLGDGPIDLVMESLATRPAATVARIFRNAPITVYSDGLMSYGPTRDPLPLHVSQRLTGLVHLDLVAGLKPVLLREHDVPTTALDVDRLGAVMRRIAATSTEARSVVATTDPGAGHPTTALLVGQYLSALGLLTRDEEGRLHAEMVATAVASGAKRVLFKPHPSAPPLDLTSVRKAATKEGVTLEVIEDPLPVEVLVATGSVDLVVGCFSTALVTAREVFGVPFVPVGTEMLLERLAPYQNSNRVPVTIIDALGRVGSRYSTVEELQRLVESVSYAMQPKMVPMLRPVAEGFLAAVPDSERRRYVKRKRLTSLGLPGGRPIGAARRTLRRLPRVRRVLGKVRRSVGRA